MERVLVDGYVRHIEKGLNDQIVPVDIYYICFEYYYTSQFIFYLASSNKENIVSILNMDNNKHWNCDILQLSDFKTKITGKLNEEEEDDYKWSVESAGIAFARNIKIPQSIHKQLANVFSKRMKYNNILFQCGGILNSWTDEANVDCNAFIINSHDFKNGNDEIIGYNWNIPNFDKPVAYNYALYSYKQNALFNIGGYDRGRENGSKCINEVYKLSFDIHDTAYFKQNMDDWKWEEMNVKMKCGRASACAAMFDNDTKMIIAGGHADGFVFIYRFVLFC